MEHTNRLWKQNLEGEEKVYMYIHIKGDGEGDGEGGNERRYLL